MKLLKCSELKLLVLLNIPAIEENFVFFNQDFLTLAKLDEDQRQLVGAVLIPDKKINRLDKDNNEEYDVFFTKETIKQAQKLFMASLRNNSHTLEHDKAVEGLTVVESWIKEDDKFDKSNLCGILRICLLVLGLYKLVQRVMTIYGKKSKHKEVRGFSIEGWFTDKIIRSI